MYDLGIYPPQFLEVKIIKNVKKILKLGKKLITVEIFPRDPNGDAYFSF